MVHDAPIFALRMIAASAAIRSGAAKATAYRFARA